MSKNLGKRVGLVGGQRRGQTYIEDLERKGLERKRACRQKKGRKMKPGEEKQLLLPGFEKMRRFDTDGT